MIASAWSSGKHRHKGTTYGLKLRAEDRDRYFSRTWTCVEPFLSGQLAPATINIAKASFWDHTCRELISAEIGRWLCAQGKTPWVKGHPPKVELEPLGGNRFSARLVP